MWLKITTNYSPNFSIPKRPKKKIKFIILHYTGMKKELDAINRLCDPKSNVSSHYFVKKNGKVINLVPDSYIAWHAGKSCWGKFKSLNKYSIGIEIQNSGHDNNYENFSSKQIKSLITLLKKLIFIYKIDPKNILGHSDIAPNRKKDPGEKFPWRKLSKFNLVKWHNLSEKKLKNLRSVKLNKDDKLEFLRNLNEIGYKKIHSQNLFFNMKILAKAFQRRYRPSLINGVIDKECLSISNNLVKI